jgi:hypothetical protein
MKRRAREELAATGSLDAELALNRAAYEESGLKQRDFLRELGSALLGLTTALSPALDVRGAAGGVFGTSTPPTLNRLLLLLRVYGHLH